MATESVLIKGDKEGVKVFINATFTQEEIFSDMRSKLSKNPEFFKNSEVKIVSNTIETIPKEFFNMIKKSLEQDYSLKVVSTYKSYLMEAKKDNHMPTEFVIGNVRSGQFLQVNGHIIVTGDVNAGAQLHADGNIVVMGVIRGTVHAGYSGDRNAIIVCKQFRAPQAQIRIADLIVFKEREGTNTIENLEIAHIENNDIVLLSKDKMYE